jgi:hypothetical protein
MAINSRFDDWIAVIAVVVLLIGTALGNAFAMLGISVVALGLLAFFRREQIGRGPILVAVMATVTSTVIAFFMAMH